jgi:hypothetical protein
MRPGPPLRLSCIALGRGNDRDEHLASLAPTGRDFQLTKTVQLIHLRKHGKAGLHVLSQIIDHIDAHISAASASRLPEGDQRRGLIIIRSKSGWAGDARAQS